VIEELGRRVEHYQAEAKAELAQRESARSSRRKEALDEELSPHDPKQRRIQFEERQLQELAYGCPLLLEWFRLSQALLEKRPAEARIYLQKLTEAQDLSYGMSQRVAGALAELGDGEQARELLEAALQLDPENPLVHAQLAGIHFQARHFDTAITAATESLSLLYFQPGVHALLGRALIETKRFGEAEQELRVAVAQSPRHLAAHELLAKLYRDQLNRPADAFAHEGRARSLRIELTAGHKTSPPRSDMSDSSDPSDPSDSPSPFDSTIDPAGIITIVSGLPRSGTSMMMQLLVAAGREALTDSKRVPDEDNPLGYFEFEKTIDLAKDISWVPQARGKVVKVVAQLLPFLPPNEHYKIIFMERNLAEVIASQNAMLARQGRRGAELNQQQLLETFTAQLQRVRAQLRRRPNIRTLALSYGELLADPAASVDRVAQFLGDPFNRHAATESIRPQLRRHKALTDKPKAGEDLWPKK